MPDPPPEPLALIVAALLSGGGIKYAYDAWRDWKNAPPRAIRAIDANIATVARARDELAEDNARLRVMLVESTAQRVEAERLHAEERSRWQSDQERLRADVARLESRLRTEQAESTARYDALLMQVHQLRLRANPEGI